MYDCKRETRKKYKIKKKIITNNTHRQLLRPIRGKQLQYYTID